jgi:hypothetical protein
MGWEKRGSRRYYYRKRRIGRQVVSEYVGGGELGETAAACDTEARRNREAEKEQWRKDRHRVTAIEQAGLGIGEAIRDLAKAWLLVAGYHTHKGKWRRRRGT